MKKNILKWFIWLIYKERQEFKEDVGKKKSLYQKVEEKVAMGNEKDEHIKS